MKDWRLFLVHLSLISKFHLVLYLSRYGHSMHQVIHSQLVFIHAWDISSCSNIHIAYILFIVLKSSQLCLNEHGSQKLKKEIESTDSLKECLQKQAETS